MNDLPRVTVQWPEIEFGDMYIASPPDYPLQQYSTQNEVCIAYQTGGPR